MIYESRSYEYLLGLTGFSDELLKNHFTLYEGYVKNTNLLDKELHQKVVDLSEKTTNFAELKRRFGWEFNGMRLHEYYFENLTPGGTLLDEKSDLHRQIAADFGSYNDWLKDFVATGMMRGVGWVVLYFDLNVGRLFNVWIGEHNVNHLTGAVPILAMDVWEHAYMIDYGIKRDRYIEAFFDNLDWEEVSMRFEGLSVE